MLSFVKKLTFKVTLYHFAFALARNESSCCFTSSLAFGGVSFLDWGLFNKGVVLSYCCLSHLFLRIQKHL